MASSCALDMRSVTGVASSSLGISDATTRTNSRGCVHAAVISAGLPNACHASQRSRKNSSLSLLREPFGLPLGLPDWPGFQGINPRCLCSRSVESLSAVSAFDIVNQTHFVARLSASPNVCGTSSGVEVTLVSQADEFWMVCFYTELRGRALLTIASTFNVADMILTWKFPGRPTAEPREARSAARYEISHRKEYNDRDSADQQYVIHVLTGHPSAGLVCAFNNSIVFDVRHSRILLPAAAMPLTRPRFPGRRRRRWPSKLRNAESPLAHSADEATVRCSSDLCHGGNMQAIFA
jgi:hypothetical protein